MRHSFPTRRSSDLSAPPPRLRRGLRPRPRRPAHLPRESASSTATAASRRLPSPLPQGLRRRIGLSSKISILFRRKDPSPQISICGLVGRKIHPLWGNPVRSPCHDWGVRGGEAVVGGGTAGGRRRRAGEDRQDQGKGEEGALHGRRAPPHLPLHGEQQ